MSVIPPHSQRRFGALIVYIQLSLSAQASIAPLNADDSTAQTNEHTVLAYNGTSTAQVVRATANAESGAASARISLATKPFPCPRKNCKKSYKQSSGLKYHLTHGTCSPNSHEDRIPVWQALLANDDPTDKHCVSDGSKHGSVAESVRPYACTVEDCTRRYQTIAGLKYHYFHSALHGIRGLQLLAGGKHECLPSLTKRVRRTAMEQAAAALGALKLQDSPL